MKIVVVAFTTTLMLAEASHAADVAVATTAMAISPIMAMATAGPITATATGIWAALALLRQA